MIPMPNVVAAEFLEFKNNGLSILYGATEACRRCPLSQNSSALMFPVSDRCWE